MKVIASWLMKGVQINESIQFNLSHVSNGDTYFRCIDFALYQSCSILSKRRSQSFLLQTYQGEVEPEKLLKLSQHVTNIFEAPTLFYVACLAAMIVNEQSMVFLILAWSYVFLRTVHAYIHIGRNKLKRRIAAYFTSWFVLLAMWCCLIIKIENIELNVLQNAP